MSDNIKITPDNKPHPNLRKLARALIGLARQQLAEEATQQEPPTEQAS
jgi:hypothetical protein